MTNRKMTPILIESFKKQLCDDEKSEATIEKYIRDVCHFACFTEGAVVNKRLAAEYKAQLAQKYMIASANSMLAALNSFFKFAGWYDCCVKQFKVQKQTYCSEEKELTQAEYFRLIHAARQKGNRRMDLIIQTIGSTGIRVSELEFITAEAVHKGEAMVTSKGRTRTVFLVKKLRKRLLQYIDDRGIRTGPVFISRNGKPLNRSRIWREMKSLCKKANVLESKVFPHNLRHLFARIFYSMEKDLAKLADILGHGSILK